MKKNLLLILSMLLVLTSFGQNNDYSKSAALQLIKENKQAVGLSDKNIDNIAISSTYTIAETKTTMVYVQQMYKDVPVLNKMQVLAFKNGKVISNAGVLLEDMEKLVSSPAATPSVSARDAVQLAFAEQKLAAPLTLPMNVSENGKVIDYGKLAGVTEDVTAELYWFPVEGNNNTISLKLGWQVRVAPAGTDEVWHIRIDALTGKLIEKINIVIYENFESPHNNAGTKRNFNFNPPATIAADGIGSLQKIQSPNAVADANYLVIPYPYEAPSFTAAAIRSNPWTAAPGNATSLGWHSTGTTDYIISRGNNVWATEDTIGTDLSNGVPANSTTSVSPLNFNFIPNYGVEPSRNPTMQQFCITNVFYWANTVHDMTYQYGFDEVSGNYQANNQGRGGVGNDYVQALAQSAVSAPTPSNPSGHLHIGNNANFTPSADGVVGKMRMYLFDSVTILHVNTPGSIAGDYTAIQSAFSLNNKLGALGPITGQVVYYNDDASGTTHFACAAPVNSVSGKIALIDRGFGGVCTEAVPFTVKVKNAQLAGAIAVIVINNTTGNIIMAGDDNTITIPAVAVSQADGAILAAQIGNNLNVTLSGTSVLDGDLDGGIITHEYTHGISNRLTGGPAVVGCLSNAERGGEGWSDYFALMMTTNWAVTSVSAGGTPRPMGTYLTGEDAAGTGIRHYPYSTNMAISPLDYSHMAVNQGIWGTGTTAFNQGSETHNVGEIWCNMLWEMTWAIIQQENNINPNLYNFSLSGNGGNSIAFKLVMEGMRLQACSPGFTDARNAILTADMNLYGGRHQCAIWTAFAKRGLGYSALQGSSNSATDQTAAFDLPPAAAITAHPADVSVNPGDNATFTVATVPPVNGAKLLYSWQISTDGGFNWNDVSPAVTTTSITITGVTASMNGYKYRCVIKQGCTSVNSNAATLIITGSFTFNSPSPATTACPAPAQMTIVLGTVVSGSFTNPITLSSSTPPAGTTVSFLPSATVTPGNSVTVQLSGTNTLTAGSYTLTITGTASGAPTQTREITFTITAGAGPAISAQPADQTICAGGNASFSITSNAATAFKWQSSPDGTNWTDVTNGGVYTGATTATLNITAATAALNNNRYRSIASTLCGSTTSSPALLTVNSAPAITNQPASATLCVGANNTFSVTATGANLTYQWQLSTNGCAGPWNNITLANSSTYTLTSISAAQNNTAYRCVIAGTCAPSITSDCALLTVVTAVAITGQPANQIVCEGNNTSFTVTGSGSGIIYQWQVSPDGTNWTTITNGGVYTGATTATLNITGATFALNNNRYRSQLSNATCSTPGVSNAALLTVNTLPAISSQPATAAICVNSNATFSITATGTGATYQWQVSTTGCSPAVWTNIIDGGVYSGATTATLTITNAPATMNGYAYHCIVNGTCPTPATSNCALLSVGSTVTIAAGGQPANAEVCSGSNALFTVTGTGSGILYQWQSSPDGTNWTTISGATSSTLTLANVTVPMNNNRYRSLLSTATCTTPVVSSAALLTVRQLPSVGLTAAPLIALLPGQTTTLTATPSASSGGTLSYAWYRDGVAFVNTGTTYLADITKLGAYQVKIQETFSSNAICLSQSQSVIISGVESSKLFIFPSPNDGQFTVSYYNNGGTSASRTITVYDAKGAKVYTSKFPVTGFYTLTSVDIRPAQRGIYYVVIGDGNDKKLADGTVMVNW